MTAFVYYGAPRESNYQPCWYCLTGNIVTVSEISRKHAEKLHTKKIKRVYNTNVCFVDRT